MRARVLAVLVALLAGCLSQAPQASESEPGSTPEPFTYRADCLNGLLFQFVDYADTDRFLPPGFHPRDPEEFLTFSPVAFGQAGVIVLMLECVSANGTSYEAASVDIFVQPPIVPGVEPALFDFYEIERYADPAEFGGLLRQAGWPQLPGSVTFTLEPEPVPSDLEVVADVSDGAGSIMSFAGSVNAPLELGSGIVRVWRDSPAGLAYYQYEMPVEPRVGEGFCTARPGTALATFTPDTQGLNPFACPPSEPIVATFPGLSINATARFLPGVHAG